MDQASLLLRKQLKGQATLQACFRVPEDLKTTKLREARTNLLVYLNADLTRRPVEGFSAGLVDDSSLFEWAVTIMGPPDTL